ncbi:unnamed protein product [Trichobilharzia szidati]|nr:unnamed protein product [Trichobilharzia szidati]
MVITSHVIKVIIYWIMIAGVYSSPATHWSYTNEETGPKTWPKHFKRMCGGHFQSPISLMSSRAFYLSELKAIKIYRRETAPTSNNVVKNNGHSVVIEFPADTWFVSFDERFDHSYEVAQMHFHWGSHDDLGAEHILDGRKYPMEAHIVAFWKEMYPTLKEAVDRPGGLAVLGVLHEVRDTITTTESQMSKYGKLSEQLGSSLSPGVSQSIPEFNLSNILLNISTDSYFRYQGSLTTPPCTENVLWTVFTDAVAVRSAEMTLFRSLLYPNYESMKNMANNFRPVQALNPTGNVLFYRMVYRASATDLDPPPLHYISAAIFGIFSYKYM